jgi:hypothetical protein
MPPLRRRSKTSITTVDHHGLRGTMIAYGDLRGAFSTQTAAVNNLDDRAARRDRREGGILRI